MDLLKKIRVFIHYWYMRYLLATELYMVETWERLVVHLTMACLFLLVWVFNYSIVLNGIQHFRRHTIDHHAQIMS